MKKFLAIFLIIGLLFTAGCKPRPKEQAQQPSHETTPIQTTPSETTEAESKDSSALSIAALRARMKLEGKRFAVAYLGYMSMEDRTVKWFLADKGLQDISFLTDIPDTNVYYSVPQGEVYCIIPVDPETTVTFYSGDPNSEYGVVYDRLVYEGTGPEPYLLVCNEAWSADTLVTFDFPDGMTYSWFPQLDEYMFVMGYWGGEYSLSQDGYDSLDITPYARMLLEDYLFMRDKANDRWIVPTAEDLIGGTWYSEGYDEDGNRCFRQMVIHENTMDVTWNLGYDYEDNHYSGAKWTLKNENGVAVLTINFGEFAGVKSYNLLLDKESGLLYTAIDATSGQISNEWEPMYCYLNAVHPAPAPDAMAGSWVREYVEISGDHQPDEGTVCTARIVHQGDGSYYLSYQNDFFPTNSLRGVPIIIMPGEDHPYLVGRQWMGIVDYTDDGTTRYMSMTAEGYLEILNVWKEDGSEMISLERFRRAD